MYITEFNYAQLTTINSKYETVDEKLCVVLFLFLHQIKKNIFILVYVTYRLK